MLTSSRWFRRAVSKLVGTLTVITLAGLLPAAAQAQNAARPGKWTIELYGGGSSSSASSSGKAIEFEEGTPFATESGQISRAVSSWYYGDGATLLNQVLTQFDAIHGTAFPRIVPIDAALRANGGSRGGSGTFGLRIGRALSTKFSVEFNVERSLAKPALSDELQAALKAGSDSFEAAFKGLLGTAPVSNLAVTSTLTIDDRSNAQTRIAGAVKWTVYSGRRIEGYVTGGVGVIMNSDETSQATLNGRYSFRLFGVSPMDETDRVVVTVEQPKSSAMGLVGGGVTYDLSSRMGLRADVRLLVNQAKDVTKLTATPTVATATPSGVLPSVTSPGLQFSTQAGIRSSLSGPSPSVTSITASGTSRRVSFTLGVFRRF